jgi:hypothetical protein
MGLFRDGDHPIKKTIIGVYRREGRRQEEKDGSICPSRSTCSTTISE